jgi:hypothetical protein
MKYEIIKSDFGSESVKRINDDGSVSFIPMDISNSDYQEYLETTTK